MARPKKQTVDYYPHEAINGKTMFIIESRWGNDGYAFFHKLLETLCSTEGHCIDFCDPNEKEFLLAKTRVNEETATGILDKLAELGKIDKDLWSEGRIWYQKLVDNVKDAYKKRVDALPQKPSLRNQKPVIEEFPTPETSQDEVSTAGSTETKGKGKVKKITPISPSENFDTFWSSFPKKVAKKEAAKAWEKINPDDKLFQAIMLALERQKKSRDWVKDGGQFIPYPATWLNGRRWEDEAKPDTTYRPPIKAVGEELPDLT